MRSFSVLIVAALALAARAQIPSLGFCPEYLPMTGFDMERFSGIWYEAERYFQLSEVASRCVKSNYTKTSDGKYHVLNEVTSRFTGIRRVLEGEIKKAPSKAEEGKLHVKYSTVPLIPLETQYNVLETDYKNYAVLWSCSGVGPVHTQNAWIMTRQRIVPGEILQRAYGVLDKYKISKVFFVKTNQEDCADLDSADEQAVKNPVAKPPKISDAEEDDESDENPQPLAGKSAVRPFIQPDAPSAVVKQRTAEIAAEKAKLADKAKIAEEKPVLKQTTVRQSAAQSAVPAEEKVRPVPELIKRVAEQVKEMKKESVKEAAMPEPVVPAVVSELKSSVPVVAEAEEPQKPMEKVEAEVEIVKP